MIKRKQINVLLKNKFEKKIQKKNHDKEFDFFNIDLNKNEYYLIKKSKDLQQILNKTMFKSISLFTNEINQFMQN